MAVNELPVKDSSGRYLYRRESDGAFVRDSEGNKIIDDDLNSIADGFVEFAKREQLGFWQ
ncbi:hypothetical protein [uncultured Jatrophihabitans sp.]|uniref:hypothetical protein n=1 Tax=uncultured Jatrophihabitans sp. TaxID=1610747 RepID=UPI0035CA2A3D